MEEQEYATTAGQRAGDLLVLAVKLLVFIPTLDLGLVLAVLLLGRSVGITEEVKPFVEPLLYWMLLAAAPMAWFAATSGKYWRIALRGDGVVATGPGLRKTMAFADLRLLRLIGGQQAGGEGKKGSWMVRLEAAAGAPVCLYLQADAAQDLFGRVRDRSPHAAAIDSNDRIYAAKSDPDGSAKKRLARSLGLRGFAVLGSGLLTLAFAVFGHASAPDALEAGRQIALRGLALVYGASAVAVGIRLLGQLGRITQTARGPAK